jgi:hypothetical protein
MAKKKKKTQTVANLLNGVESLFLKIIIGLVAPLFFMLLGWWGSIPFVSEDSIKFFALGGLLLGILLDSIFLRRWVRNACSLPRIWFMLVYLFYSACLFGFFMGVPVFNLVMGLVGGYYTGLCLRYTGKDKAEVEAQANRTGLFAAAVLAVFCVISLVLASQEQSLAAEIQSMFDLSADVSRENILMVSGIGGAVMVVLEYFLTRAMVKFASFV